jgi:hypothetical protein
MTQVQLDQIVNAVLYEGYILYPYRPSSKKNRRERFTFGRVYPKEYSEFQKGAEPCVNQTECLLQSTGKAPSTQVTVRFLQPMWREVGYMTEGVEESFEAIPEMSVDGTLYQSWQEATERTVTVSLRSLDPSKSSQVNFPFSFASSRSCEPLSFEGGFARTAIMRRREALEGMVEVEATPVATDVFKIAVRVSNHTPISREKCDDQDAVIMRTFASTHTILKATGGSFISLMDPPAEFGPFAAQCRNIGTWPVLAGDEKQGERDTMLSSPIILYDYPQIAPESAGSFFDGTEIDEILTLRVMTMTDGEKIEMRRVDEYARQLLERTEAAGAKDLLKMHGTMREVKADAEFFNPTQPVKSIVVAGRDVRAGASVRIHPKKRADAIDMILDGKVAIVEAIEQDAEGCIHLALVLEDDPGKDLGFARQSGHRFFYSPEEVELLEEATV